MKEGIELRTGYRKNKVLRDGFNALIGKTFCLNFENWYQNGFWLEKFNPHTLFEGDRAVANISTYEMEFEWRGKVRHYVQLGGVATDEAYRKQGLSRRIMESILQEYEGKTDGIFLMANDSVLDFYPKFGFQKRIEWQCSKEVHITAPVTAVKVSMKEKENWPDVIEAIQNSVSNSTFNVVNEAELMMFYLAEFMQENVYYIEKLNAYVVAGIEEEVLTVQAVYADKVVDLNQVYEAFGATIKKVVLEFTPLDKENYEQNVIDVEDTTLFVIGEEFADFNACKVMFPVLSHT